MSTLADVRAGVKLKVGREFNSTEMDDVLDEYINMSIEVFGNLISNVYDEFLYQHTITSGEISSETNRWLLPTGIKAIADVRIIDPTGTESIYYPISIISNIDMWDTERYGLGGGSARSEGAYFDYGSDTVTFVPSQYRTSRRNTAKRVDRDGRPELCTRIGSYLEVFPRPSTAEENWIIQMLLHEKPQSLSVDGDTNTITEQFPETLEAYVSALLLNLYYRNTIAGTSWLQQAATMLQAFATQDEINQLMGTVLEFNSRPGGYR